jgi:hypothetical protein
MHEQQGLDLAFAHSYNWKYPNQEVDAALKLLFSPGITEQEIEDAFSEMTADSLEMRCLLASNPNTPSELLALLSDCPQCKVLERVASNPQTSTGVLAKLAKSPSSDVKCAVAENGNSSIETIRELMHDDDIDVRFTLAENHNLPADVLQELAGDDNPYVAYRAQTTLMRLRQVQPRQFPNINNAGQSGQDYGNWSRAM